MRKTLVACFTALLCLQTISSQAQTISQLSFYSPLISTFDMQYSNDHLVVSQNGLLIFDVSNPAQRPQLIAQRTYPGSTAYQLEVDGNNVYMAYGNNGIFAVYDIADFSNPVLRGSVAIPPLSFLLYGDVVANGNYVYLSGFDSLFIVDVTNVAAPFVTKSLAVESTAFTGITDMQRDGNTLFIKGPFSLLSYDITDPVNPALIDAQTYLHPVTTGLIADTVNHRVFIPWVSLLRDFAGHDAYDVSNPAAPQYLFSDSTEPGSGDFGNGAYAYANDMLYLHTGGSIKAFNVSSAAHAFTTSFSGQDVPNSTVAIDVKDSIIFNGRGGGIEVLQFSSSNEVACQAPLYLRSSSPSVTAYLRWDKIDGANGYRIAYKPAGTTEWMQVVTRDNMQRIHNLLPNTTYVWNVKTICNRRDADVSAWSERASFTTGNGSSIVVMPNPVKDFMQVKLNFTGAERLAIFDAAGMKHVDVKINEQFVKLHVQQLQPGNYFLRIIDRQGKLMASTNLYKQ